MTAIDRLNELLEAERAGVDRLDALVTEAVPATVIDFLHEMKTRHLANIEACDRLATSLGVR